VFINVGLRNSKTIDSDNDGVPNYFDATPLGGNSGTLGGTVLSASLVNNPSLGKGFSISWNAEANTAYTIEITGDLNAPQWEHLKTYTNAASQTQRVTVWDLDVPQGVTQRFYRVGRVLE
jgi:hypothetical protein